MAEKTNNTLIWVIGIILVLLGVVYFATMDSLPGESHEDETGPIKVGVIVPLSGDKAPVGESIQNSYNLAAEEINHSGGINERSLELIFEDGGCDTEIAKTAGEKLINDDKVHFILGGTCSNETLAVADLTKEAGVLLLSPSSADPNITEAGELVFRTYPSYDFDGKLMVEYAVSELDAEKVAILAENTDSADRIRNTFSDAAEELGVEVVFDEAFDTDQTDFDDLISDLKDERPDMTYLAAESSETGKLVLQEISDSGVRGEIFSSNTLLDRAAFKDNSSLYRDLILAEVVVDEENEKTAEFLAAFEDKYGATPEHLNFSASAYDSVYLLAEGIGEAGTDAKAVADYLLENTKDWPGSLGNLSFDENGDVLLEMSLIQVQRNGSTKTLER